MCPPNLPPSAILLGANIAYNIGGVIEPLDTTQPQVKHLFPICIKEIPMMIQSQQETKTFELPNTPAKVVVTL